MADHAHPKLLPCPFCLTSNVRIHPRTCDRKSPYNTRDRAFPIARCACGVSVDGKDWGDEITAIEAWNRRAAPAPGGEVNERLVKAFADVLKHFPTDDDMLRARWTAREIDAAFTAYEVGRAAIADAERAKE